MLVLDQVRLFPQAEPVEYGGRCAVTGIDAGNDPVQPRHLEAELEHGTRTLRRQSAALELRVQDVAQLPAPMLDAAQEQDELTGESTGVLVDTSQGDPVAIRLQPHVHVPLECCLGLVGVPDLPGQVAGDLFPTMQIGELDIVAAPVGTQRHPLSLTSQVGEVHRHDPCIMASWRHMPHAPRVDCSALGWAGAKPLPG